MSGSTPVTSSISGASQVSTQLNPSSATDRVKFGGGSSSPCMFRNTTSLLADTIGSLLVSIVLHLIDVLSLSLLAGMDKDEENIPEVSNT